MILLLFDIDGTLIRSDGAGRTAMAQAIEEVSGIASPLDGVSLGGKTDPLILAEVFERAGHSLDGQAPAIFDRYLEALALSLNGSFAGRCVWRGKTKRWRSIIPSMSVPWPPRRRTSTRGVYGPASTPTSLPRLKLARSTAPSKTRVPLSSR